MYNQLIELNATSIMVLVNVLILFIIFKKFFFEKLRKFMLDRQERVRVALENAEQADLEAKRITTRYENAIADLEKESRDIIRNGRAQAESAAQDIIAQAELEAKHIKEDARRIVEIENMQNRESVRREISSLAIMAAEQIMDENLDADKQQQIINDVIDSSEFSRQL